MGRRRTFDTEEAVSTATRLFWRSYDKTSLSDLTEAMGIAPASFYFAFGSKEALFRQVVNRYTAQRADAFEHAFEASSPAAAVRELLRGYVDVVTDPAHAPGCLVVNNSPATGPADALRHWLAEIRQALGSRLEARFRADRAAGDLPENSDPAMMARFVATLAGGLAVEAQSGTGRQDLYKVIDFALANFPAPIDDRGESDAACSTSPRATKSALQAANAETFDKPG